MKRFALVLDLIDDPQRIKEYEDHHKEIWPEIKKSIKDSGILNMEIYRFSNRLFMVIDAEDDFSFENKAALDAANPKVQEWEELMWKYQKALPEAKPGEKWLPAEKIFSL